MSANEEVSINFDSSCSEIIHLHHALFFLPETEASIVPPCDKDVPKKVTSEINPLYEILSDHCILTPFTPTSRAGLQTLTEYLDERGVMPSEKDSALICRDIAKALSFLKSEGVVDVNPAEEKIAILMVCPSYKKTFPIIYSTWGKAPVSDRPISTSLTFSRWSIIT